MVGGNRGLAMLDAAIIKMRREMQIGAFLSEYRR